MRPRVADLESIAGSVSCFMYSMKGVVTYDLKVKFVTREGSAVIA